jgi:acetyl esterase/lipase
MPSLQSNIFRFLLRYRHLKRKPVIDWNTSIPQFRRDCEKAARLLGRVPAGIEVEPVKVAGLRGEWILPAGSGKDKVILYIHGGGYVSGSCTDHRAIVARVARGAGVGALLFEYRLAPENPFPAALEDSVSAYRWLLARGTAPAQIIFAGESAGGGLCLATLLALRDQGLPLPAAAVAISPWTDLNCTGESYRTKNEVSLAPAGSWTVFSKYYAGHNDPGLPLISPLYGDLRGLPPILMVAGEDDELFDDSVRFAQKAGAAGVDITLQVGERMVHCYPLLPSFIPEARQALEGIFAFVKRHLGK